MSEGKNRNQVERVRVPIVTAILVDGGFYTYRANRLFGEKSPRDRALELQRYCQRHVKREGANLYRILYYDCPPSNKAVFHPLLQKNVSLKATETYKWATEFHQELLRLRKVAFRRGEELDSQTGYTLKNEAVRKLLNKTKTVDDLCEDDFYLSATQKGVDMRIGLDIASLAQQRQVNQIIMITGDSDFVPAAKLARRSGIDFILDPMWAHITPTLKEHVDGIYECVNRPPQNESDPLHANNWKENTEEDDIY